MKFYMLTLKRWGFLSTIACQLHSSCPNKTEASILMWLVPREESSGPSLLVVLGFSHRRASAAPFRFWTWKVGSQLEPTGCEDNWRREGDDVQAKLAVLSRTLSDKSFTRLLTQTFHSHITLRHSLTTVLSANVYISAKYACSYIYFLTVQSLIAAWFCKKHLGSQTLTRPTSRCFLSALKPSLMHQHSFPAFFKTTPILWASPAHTFITWSTLASSALCGLCAPLWFSRCHLVLFVCTSPTTRFSHSGQKSTCCNAFY